MVAATTRIGTELDTLSANVDADIANSRYSLLNTVPVRSDISDFSIQFASTAGCGLAPDYVTPAATQNRPVVAT